MEPLSPKDPKSIGDYTLIGRLGSGGMGIVYLAANGPDSVALKVIRESLLEDPSQATRFSREIETLKKINSPYVAKIINSGVTDGQAWYATEFVNGPDLKSLVDAKGPLKGDVWVSLAKGLLQGISAIHAQGIIHRDIKPANVIIAESGPKIIDFGIAQVSDATSVTSTGLVAGTPAWFSPEQIEGKSLTVATDLFSAGSVLTFAATGKSPWGDENTMTKASVYGILVSEPNLTGASAEQLRIISPLLEKDPSKRTLPAAIMAQANSLPPQTPSPGKLAESKSPKPPKTFRGSDAPNKHSESRKSTSRRGSGVGAGGIGLVAAFLGIAGLVIILFWLSEPQEEELIQTVNSPAVDLQEVAPSTNFLACAVSDAEGWRDNSFNQDVYRALLQAESELGVQIAEAESNGSDDFGPNLQAMVDARCDVIIAVGVNLVADVNIAAAINPDVSFVTVDGWSEGNGNLKPVGYKMNQSSYLAGYLAAAYSTTKVVGTYGGLQIDAVTDRMSGFYYGAKAYEAETGTPVTVLGWDPVAAEGQFWGGFAPNDAAGKSIAASQLEQGADVLFPVGGDQFGAGIEAIKGAGDNAVMVGVEKDIALTSPEHADYIITSAEKRMGAATFDIIEDYAVNGNFTGDYYMGDLANEGTDISPFYAFDEKIDQSIKDRLAELKAGIIDGSIDPLASIG